MKWIDNLIDKQIDIRMKELEKFYFEEFLSRVVELDMPKSYILILPESITEKDIESGFKDFKTDVNLMVVRADKAKIISLG